ncbi:hypothetical protein IWQ61_007997 [Dispira simplex]|nr:hypothetical protein IWQ61_007997 [Dispira simplex]
MKAVTLVVALCVAYATAQGFGEDMGPGFSGPQDVGADYDSGFPGSSQPVSPAYLDDDGEAPVYDDGAEDYDNVSPSDDEGVLYRRAFVPVENYDLYHAAPVRRDMGFLHPRSGGFVGPSNIFAANNRVKFNKHANQAFKFRNNKHKNFKANNKKFVVG